MSQDTPAWDPLFDPLPAQPSSAAAEPGVAQPAPAPVQPAPAPAPVLAPVAPAPSASNFLDHPLDSVFASPPAPAAGTGLLAAPASAPHPVPPAAPMAPVPGAPVSVAPLLAPTPGAAVPTAPLVALTPQAQVLAPDVAESRAADPVRQVLDTTNRDLADGVNRCPKCGSTEVQLRGSTGMLMCQFCRHQWQEGRVEEEFGLGEGIDELEGTTVSSGAGTIASTDDVITMTCSGCGAEVVVDTAHALNARCHWCRHTLNVNQQTSNGAVPDAVLPFQLTHDQAVEKIRDFVASRQLFAHRRFRKEFVPENVVGVYLPYLVVDARADTSYLGTGEVETRRWRSDDKTYYSADVFRVERSVSFTVDDLTMEAAAERVRANGPATNNIINTIMPFDTKNAVKWNASYLVGYTSEKRDMEVDDLQLTLHDQLLSIGRSQVHHTLAPLDRGVRWEEEKIDIGGSRWVSMYLPVWLYSYYQENTGMLHYIAVNARTGETMGSVPVAKGRLLLAAATAGTFVEGLALAALGVM